MTATIAQPDHRRAPIDGWLAGLSVEAGLYVGIGLLALTIRLWGLGDFALTEAEAREALSAWRRASAASFEAVQPVSAAWYALTVLSFWLAGASETGARFWPALAGTAVVFAPAAFRGPLGRGPALAASGLLAISGLLAAASRTADGTTLAALSLVVLVAALRRAAEAEDSFGLIVAGVAFGFGLATGPRFISGLAALALGVLLVVFVRPETMRPVRLAWRALMARPAKFMLAAGLTLVVTASAALTIPSGLSAAGAAAPKWLAGWAGWEVAQPAWLVPQLVFAHEPVLWIMGLGGVYIAYLSGIWHSLAARFQMIAAAREQEPEAAKAGDSAYELQWRGVATVLATLALGALMFTVLYPGREAADSVWVVLPLAMLAGKLLVETFNGEWFEGELETVLAQAGVLFVMLVFIYFHLAGFGRGYVLVATQPIEIRLMLAGGVLALAVFVTVMFALGWSRLSAVRGAVVALGLAALIGSVGSGLALAYWRAHDVNNLWTPEPTAPNLKLLVKTVEDIALRSVGKEEDLEVVIVSGAPEDVHGLLAWELRAFRRLRFVSAPAAAAGSPVVIATSATGETALAAEYVGERFPIQSRQLLAPPTLQTLINWWLFRVWPTDYSRSVDLWVRPDVHNLVEQR